MIGYLFEIDMSSIVLVGGCVIGWIVTISLIYTLITGKNLGSKRYRVLQKFDRYRLGDRRWRWRTIAEIVIVIITTFVLNVDIHSLRLDLPYDAFHLLADG